MLSIPLDKPSELEQNIILASIPTLQTRLRRFLGGASPNIDSYLETYEEKSAPRLRGSHV